MKKITTLLIILMSLFSKESALAFGPYGELSNCTNYYITSNAGWSNSEYYQIIDIDAAKLTDSSLPKSTAEDGSKNSANTDFGSGFFSTPVMTTSDGVTYTPTSVLWPVNYYMASFAPTLYTSAYSKVNLYGSSPSGTGTTAACTLNDNSVKASGFWNKPGYIELSRQGSAVLNTPPSLHGYIILDSLPQVERIQWSYSSTSWKRGVKADIDYHDGKGWQPLRWAASDYNAFEATFSEQGYQFEEIIGKQDDPNSYVSFRIRIWDGDSIHNKVNANDLTEQEVLYTATMQPYDQKQTVRVHQIKVFSNIVPTAAPKPIPTGLKRVNENQIKYFLSDGNLILSEEVDIEIYSILGQKIYNSKTNRVNTSDFNPGIYILKLTDKNGYTQSDKIRF